VGGGACDRAVGEAAGTIDLGLADEGEEVVELLFRLAGEAGNEGAADHQFRTRLAPMRDALQVLLAAGRALHAPQLAQRADQFEHARLDRLAVPEARAVPDVHAIGRSGLADDQKFLYAALEQRFGSANTSPTGRETRSPRIDGMMQKVQR